MCKKIIVLPLLLSLAACHSHGGSDRSKTYHIRFNPPVGSTYHYELTNETSLTVKGGEKDADLHNVSDMAVNYRIGKDSDEFVLEMSYDKIHINGRNGDVVREVDAAGAPRASDPASQLVAAMKTDTIYARVHPADLTVAFSGGLEVVGPMVERNYAEADKEQAREYWQQWVEQGIIWKNLDPLTWIFPVPALPVGGRWTTSSTNREDINFKIENSFQLESVHAGIVTIRLEGRVSNDSAGTWLMGNRVRCDLTGKEEGVCFVDIATGMPVAMEFSIDVEGNVKTGDRPARIKYGMTIKMKGGKVN
jgi:hypothetical protein